MFKIFSSVAVAILLSSSISIANASPSSITTSRSTQCAKELSPSVYFDATNLCQIMYTTITNNSPGEMRYEVVPSDGGLCGSVSGVVSSGDTSSPIGGWHSPTSYEGVGYVVYITNMTTGKRVGNFHLKQNYCWMSAGSIKSTLTESGKNTLPPEVVTQNGCFSGCGGGMSGRAGFVNIIIP